MSSPIEPPAIHQETTTNTTSPSHTNTTTNTDCPFCTIITNYPPTSPHQSSPSNTTPEWNPDKLDPPAYVLLSTPDVVAFLDIAPLTRGHVLVAPRNHRVKVGDMLAGEMAEIGRLLPLISRAVIRAVLPDIPHAEADYNIVQNDGPGAAQVVPHVHFHIVPRPPLNYRPPSPNTLRNLQVKPPPSTPSSRTRNYSFSRVNHTPPSSKSNSHHNGHKKSKYPPNEIPTGMKKSYILFGRGVRNELDDEDAAGLVEEMRRCVSDEWQKEFGDKLVTNGQSDQRQGLVDRSRDRRGERSPEKL